VKIICPYCNKESEVRTGCVNRAKKLRVPIYCGRVCSGLARRVNRTTEECKKIKADYDKARLNGPLRDKILEEKRQYAKTEAGRASQKRNRTKRMPLHVEYCRQPQYKEYKKQYDKTRVAKQNYGEFWEASIVCNQLEEIILPEKHEAKIQKGTYNKSQKRKRLWNSRPKI
jgi:hypothetical protein